MKTKLIIDTDSGMDDIIAITMILANNKTSIDLIGISTVFGLVKPDIGSQNLARICNYFGTNIDLCIGSNRPLSSGAVNNRFPEEDIKKATELTFLEPVLKKSVAYIPNTSPVEDWLYKTCALNPGTVILCIGPLTNIAITIKKYKSEFGQIVGKLVIMGGALSVPGNVLPARSAEYNIYCDPTAAEIVFSSGIPIELVPLDATKYVPVDRTYISRISGTNVTNNYGQIIRQILLNNDTDFFYFYDPLAAALILNPSIASYSKSIRIRVTTDGISQGKTAVARSGKRYVRYIEKVNPKTFYSMVLTCLTNRILLR
jgi:inosine-uridine nucleoside N-ribohydrolase